MKHGQFWMTTAAAGLVIAGMMAAGRSAVQNPALLFLAGQIKVATGHTEDGMRLMNLAAAQRDSENGKVHAAEPAAKPTEVCKNGTSNVSPSHPPAKPAAMASPKSKPAVAVMAKLDLRVPAAPPIAPVSVSIDPAAFQYLTEAERAQVVKAQMDFQKAQREKMKQLHKVAHAMVIKYVPSNAGFAPADISYIQRELPTYLGQTVQ